MRMEIYVVIDKEERTAILDEATFVKFRNEGSLEGRNVLVCSTQRSFAVESAGIIKEKKYEFELIP